MKIRPSLVLGALFCVLLIGFVGWRLQHRGAAPGRAEVETAEPPTEPSREAVIAERSQVSTSSRLQAGAADFLIPVPLRDVVTEEENSPWVKDEAYSNIPRGTQTVGGIPFLFEGMIQLQGRGSEMRRRNYRTTVKIPLAAAGIVATNIRSLHLVGATRYEEIAGAEAADLVWHYADGSSQRVSLNYMENIRDWTRQPFEQPARLSYPFAEVIWAEQDAKQPSRWHRIYRVALPNPTPAKTVDHLELVSARGMGTLFVIGMTLDSLPAGARLDSSPDMEPGDSEPAHLIHVLVQSQHGQPLPEAKVRAQVQHSFDRAQITSASIQSDAAGRADLYYPSRDLDVLEIVVSHDDYAARRLRYNLKTGDTVPTHVTVTLGEGVEIGGVMVDENDSPIPDVQVSLYRYWSGGDEMRTQSGVNPDFRNAETRTDAEGKWVAGGLPVELLHRIGFNVQHDDFTRTNVHIQAGAMEKELRAKTFKLALRRGLHVLGRVEDAEANPVSGAKVFVGRRFWNDRQETQTDSNGAFQFRKLAAGETLFSVMAADFEAVSKTVNVQPRSSEIVFTLKSGKAMRALVQNESKEPIAGARLWLDANFNGQEGFDFEGRTGEDGRFEWKGAPSGSLQFSVSADGYESRRDVRLAPDTENVVTLRREREIHGLVLDAATEQPVTRFTVRTGMASPGGNSVSGVIRDEEFAAQDGRFVAKCNESSENAVLVKADGYADKVAMLSNPVGGVCEVVVRLKKTGTLEGIVVLPSGSPAPGVTVAVIEEGNWDRSVQLQAGRLTSHGGNKIEVTDENGRFKIGTIPETGRVVAAGTAGFAAVPMEQVEASRKVVLQEWGRIEGVLKVAGAPGVGEEVLFTLPVQGLSMDFNGYKAAADSEGKFTIENVPPGNGQMVRLIKASEREWMHSHQTPVTVESGKTTLITLGDSGATITARVQLQVAPPTNGTFSIRGMLSTSRPPMPRFNSPEETRAYINSAAWKEITRNMRNYQGIVKPDGTLTIDGVVPGSYMLSVTATERQRQGFGYNPPFAEGRLDVTVPENVVPNSSIYVGEIVLKPRQSGSVPGHF